MSVVEGLRESLAGYARAPNVFEPVYVKKDDCNDKGVYRVHTDDNKSDLGTKALTRIKHDQQMKLNGIMSKAAYLNSKGYEPDVQGELRIEKKLNEHSKSAHDGCYDKAYFDPELDDEGECDNFPSFTPSERVRGLKQISKSSKQSK